MLTLKSYALLELVHLKFKFSCVSSVFMGSLYLSLSGRLDGVKNISLKFSEMAKAWAGGEPWPLTKSDSAGLQRDRKLYFPACHGACKDLGGVRTADSVGWVTMR